MNIDRFVGAVMGFSLGFAVANNFHRDWLLGVLVSVLAVIAVGCYVTSDGRRQDAQTPVAGESEKEKIIKMKKEENCQ